METITKIDDENIEVTKDVTTKIRKSNLLEEKANLESNIAEYQAMIERINNLLKSFD